MCVIIGRDKGGREDEKSVYATQGGIRGMNVCVFDQVNVGRHLKDDGDVQGGHQHGQLPLQPLRQILQGVRACVF